MNMRMKSSGRFRSSGSIAHSISGRAKTRKIEDNRPLSEAYRVLQQKMGDCPPSPVLSCVPGYGGERISPHSSVAQGKGVVQRQIKVKGMEIATVWEKIVNLAKPFQKVEECLAVFDCWEKDADARIYNSVADLFWDILSQVKREEKSESVEEVKKAEKPRPQFAPDINPNLPYVPESKTRVGFEIESGNHYYFPIEMKDQIENFTNQTLATYYIKEGKEFVPLLEMLIDDIGVTKSNLTDAQVEFRTVPLEFEALSSELSGIIKNAISGFNTFILAFPGIRLQVDEGYWMSSSQLPIFPQEGEKKMQAPPTLAQHVTYSIESEAFSRLDAKLQNVLVPYLAGCRSRQDVFNKLVDFVYSCSKKTSNGMQVDASVTMRNRAGYGLSNLEGGKTQEGGICFKSPLEVMLAADKSLNDDYLNEVCCFFSHVYLNDQYIYPMGKLRPVVNEMKKFPKIQGEAIIGSGEVGKIPEEQIGYRVIAEKLQPLLLDQKSGRPRILFEHRGGAFVRAINDALKHSRSKLMAYREILIFCSDTKNLEEECTQFENSLKEKSTVYAKRKDELRLKFEQEKQDELESRSQELEGFYLKRRKELQGEGFQELEESYKEEKEKLLQEIHQHWKVAFDEEIQKLEESYSKEKEELQQGFLQSRRQKLKKKIQRWKTAVGESCERLGKEIQSLEGICLTKKEELEKFNQKLKGFMSKEKLSPDELEFSNRISQLKKELKGITQNIVDKKKQLNNKSVLFNGLGTVDQSIKSGCNVFELEKRVNDQLSTYLLSEIGEKKENDIIKVWEKISNASKVFIHIVDAVKKMDEERVALKQEGIVTYGQEGENMYEKKEDVKDELIVKEKKVDKEEEKGKDIDNSANIQEIEEVSIESEEQERLKKLAKDLDLD